VESSFGPVYDKSVALVAADVKAATKRAFVKSMKKKAKEEEAARVKKEKEAEKARLKEEKAAKKASIKSNKSAAGAQTLKRRGKVAADGTQVFVRDEQLTMRVGPLPDHWEKKVDAKTGRFYFKNHQTRQTTWIDPRTAETRKKNALETDSDELPYGWDEAEVNGETYYIDHLTQKTHWLHPRLLLEEMREEFQEREEQLKGELEAMATVIKDLRDKRGRLEDKKAEAGDEEIDSLNERIAALDEVIDTEVDKKKDVQSVNKDLKSEMKKLNDQFLAANFAKDGNDAKNFNADDVEDLYALKKTDTIDEMPAKLGTLKRNELKAKTNAQ